MEQDKNGYVSSRESSLEIADILLLVLRYWWLVILLPILFCAAAYEYTHMTYAPMYAATASIIVNSKQQITATDGSTVYTSNDVNLSENLVNTYDVILRSNRITESVVEKLKLPISGEQLRSYINLSPVKDTSILNVMVLYPDPQTAAAIANALIEVAPAVIMDTVEVGSVKAVDQAKVPEQPIPPDTLRNIGLGGAVGLALAVGIALLIGMLNPKILRPSDIKEKLARPLLGVIPHAGDIGGRRSLGRHAAPPLMSFAFLEAFRTLRTNIEFLIEKNKLHVLLVTSPRAQDGKTTIALNLASALCYQYKVLLIDFDLRKPSVLNNLGALSDSPVSLSALLEGTRSIEDALYINKTNDLHVLSFAEPTVNAVDLFGSDKMEELINTAKKQYDIVLMDTPPAQLVADAVKLSKYADGVLITVRQQKTSLNAAAQTINDLRAVHSRILGLVLNDSRHVRLETRYHYRYYHKKNQKFGYYNGAKTLSPSQRSAAAMAKTPQNRMTKERAESGRKAYRSFIFSGKK